MTEPLSGKVLDNILVSGQRGEAGEPVTPVRFVVLAAPRTGSNWLCSMLNSHPDVLCHHEIFNPAGIHYALDHRGDIDIGTVDERDQSPTQCLARLWRYTFGKRIVGFKINRGQNSTVFRSVLDDHEIRKLVVVRRNRIKTFVSELIAEKTGQWESYGSGGPGLEPTRVEVKLESLLGHIALNEKYYADIYGSLETSGQRFLQVAYEDMAQDEEMARVLTFLGAEPRAAGLVAATTKQNSTSLRDIVCNLEQLDQALKGMDLHKELHASGL